MKRRFKVLSFTLVILVLVSIFTFVTFAADNCDHDWQYESGYIDVTRHCLSIITYKCSLCSDTKTEEGVNSHKPSGTYKYVDADTCMAVCKECATWYELPCHVWDNGKVDRSPTCTSAGTFVYTCVFCKGRKTEVISKLSHDLDADGVCKVCSLDLSEEDNQPVETDTSNDSSEDTSEDPNETTKEPDETTKVPNETTSTPVKDHEHNWSPWKKVDSNNHSRSCQDSDCSAKETKSHEDKDTDGKCDVCNGMYLTEVPIEKILAAAFGVALVLGIIYMISVIVKKRKE